MKERILYIDNLRAFAIMLVVMGHILQFTFGDSHGFDHPFFKFIYSFHMPLFFFISGMFAKGFTPPLTLCKYLNNNIVRKSKALLIPYITWSLIINLLISVGAYSKDILNTTSLGALYWFLPSLFEAFILFFILQPLVCRLNKRSNIIIEILYWLIVIFSVKAGILWLCKEVLSSSEYYYTFLGGFQNNFPFFLMGYLVAKYKKIIALLENDCVGLVAWILYLGALYLINCTEFRMKGVSSLIEIFYPVGAIIFFYQLFKHISFPSKIQRIVSKVGMSTLEIYVMHYLCFIGISEFRYYFQPLTGNILFMLLYTYIVSLIIILICLILKASVSYNKWMSMIMFGKTVKKPE